MKKDVGKFSGDVWTGGWPVVCIIKIDEREIRFEHRDLADLEHMVAEMKKAAISELPDRYKGEV